jgi:hypothetical protein
MVGFKPSISVLQALCPEKGFLIYFSITVSFASFFGFFVNYARVLLTEAPNGGRLSPFADYSGFNGKKSEVFCV